MKAVPQITIVVPGRWHAFELARELEQLGALHRIVTNYPKSRTRRWGIPDHKVVSLPFTFLLTKLAWKLGGDSLAMQLQYRINNLFARRAARHLGKPDLVHAWAGTAEPSLLVARRRGIPTVLERSSSHMTEQCRLLRLEYTALGLRWVETPRLVVERELREYSLASQIFVPSRFVWKSFSKFGFSTERLFLNGFGVDASAFHPVRQVDDIFRILFAGTLSVRKGIHHLVSAFRLAGIPDSELLLVGGSTGDTDQLVGPADTNIRRIGHVPQASLPALYQRATVFVMASIEEGQAMVQAQALACGLPLICTSNTGGEDFLMLDGDGREIVEGVREYPAGYVVPPGDPAAIAFVIRRLAADPRRVMAMRKAAGLLAQRDLSWQRYAAVNLARYVAIGEAARNVQVGHRPVGAVLSS